MVWRETEEANLATSLSKNTGNFQLNLITEPLNDLCGQNIYSLQFGMIIIPIYKWELFSYNDILI